MKNIFTIDTEDWYHANYSDNLFENSNKLKSTVEGNVDELLDIFARYSVKATFFVLGTVVEDHPGMIKKIAKEGHEIASHGYGHQLVYKQTPEEFREDIRKAKVLAEDVVGEEVIGYRAPSWSITDQSLWALNILEEEGFKYTSSIFPTKNFLYGIPYAPRFIHKCDVYGEKDLKLIQIPPSTAKMMGRNIPFSGGAYFRLFPAWYIKTCTKVINQKEKQPVIYYLHPREIDPKQPHLDLKGMDWMIHYYGIRGCKGKLKNILACSEFVTMREFLYHSQA